jgi:hypothetical protein
MGIAPMTETKPLLSDLHARLGFKRLSRTWAKIEILLGLAGAGAGMLLGNWTLSRPVPEPPWSLVAIAMALFVLGGYLTMAGSRSHLYQSNNELTAYLAQEIQRLGTKVDSK